MKYLSIAVSGISAAMIALNWDTPLAVAWTVAFCGWVPHCFPTEEAQHGNS